MSDSPAPPAPGPEPRRAKRTLRSALPTVVKVIVAAALLTWLLRSGNLDFRVLGLLVERPLLGAANLGLFAFVLAVSTLRWQVLLAVAGVRTPYPWLLRLQSAAVFFNFVIPGNVGGDLLKTYYVARDVEPEKRASILLISFVDRIVGLAALLILASIVVLVRGSAVLGDPQLRPLAYPVLLLGSAAVVGPTVLIVIMRKAGHHLDAWTGGTTKFAKLFNQLVAGLRLLSGSPSRLFAVLGLGMVAHASAMGMFTLLASAITGADVPFSSVATIFPLGILTVVLPISPAGMGVGHVAFEKLFATAGITGGANVFNVYLIGQFAPNLLGVLPYLTLRRQGLPPTPTQRAG